MCGCNKNKKRATTTVSTASQQPILTSVAKPIVARAQPPPSRPVLLQRPALPRPKPVRSTLAASIPRGPRIVQRKKKTLVLKRK